MIVFENFEKYVNFELILKITIRIKHYKCFSEKYNLRLKNNLKLNAFKSIYYYI